MFTRHKSTDAIIESLKEKRRAAAERLRRLQVLERHPHRAVPSIAVRPAKLPGRPGPGHTGRASLRPAPARCTRIAMRPARAPYDARVPESSASESEPEKARRLRREREARGARALDLG
jgi:hypothetical protein